MRNVSIFNAGSNNLCASRKWGGILLLIVILSLSYVPWCFAQQESNHHSNVNPRNALLKSLVMPGWGHLSLGDEHASRGKFHLGSEIALWLGYAGFTVRAQRLENKLVTQATTYADIDIEGRNQQLWIAIGQYDDLASYNQRQLLNRNWDELYDDVPANRWNWQSDQYRQDFESTRNTWNRTKQQLPAMLSAMILNRVVAGISAFRRARKLNEAEEEAQAHLLKSEKAMTVQVAFQPNIMAPYSAHSFSALSVQPVIQIQF